MKKAAIGHRLPYTEKTYFEHPFVDAEAMAKENPETFHSPSFKLLQHLESENDVKVCLNGERFWVTVEKNAVTEELLFCRVSNILDADHPVQFGDLVAVHYNQVYEINILPF